MLGPDLKKLTITACTVSDGKVKVGSDTFKVMLNPSSYWHEYGIDYDRQKTLGQSAANPSFSAVDAERVGFDLVVDGTGAVASKGLGSTPDEVSERIRALRAIVYQYRGNEHEPSVVRLLWGSFIFFGRLTSMKVEYTLFKPAGEPLRAKVSLAFVGFMTKEEEALRAKRSSPDLSHRVLVRAGDTLPLLCHRVYKDASYYAEVARYNDLTDFRMLEPGTVLHFPPLRTR